MSLREARPNDDDEGGHSVSVASDQDGATDQDRSGRREPASDEEAEQNNSANTDDQEA